MGRAEAIPGRRVKREEERPEHSGGWVEKPNSLLLLCCTLPELTWGSNVRLDILSRDS